MARPRIFEDRAEIRLYLERRDWRALSKLAHKGNKSISAVVRDMVERELCEQEGRV
ncbi:MAG: hypothetical protein AB7G80_09880 [Dongiaceae bacterium]